MYISTSLMFSDGRLYAVSVAAAARVKASVYCRSLAGIAGANPSGSMDVCLL